ncbi:virulence-associated E family protein [Burkholderia sp. Cy-637]|uniref:virulence-associated E family protein n=1 Tax=Burkholderia sp. Cy-637 TaxID=2608327 RepID=UPI001F036A5D|nr:virulence-associated E family protein [Burkholderia sp. Cy-637]
MIMSNVGHYVNKFPVENHGDDEVDFSLDDQSEEMVAAANIETRSHVQRTTTRRSEMEVEAESARQEPDLVKRARLLSGLQAINFPEVKRVKSENGFETYPVSCDPNRVAVLHALFGEKEQRPHFDEFKGRVVDYRGKTIDDHYSTVDLMSAFGAAGLKSQSMKVLRDTLKEYALSERRNDLIDSLNKRIPAWDGVERLDMALINLFKPLDSKLNRNMSRYFFMSLYARLMHPGAFAPVVLCLIGGQNAGKSYFGKLICEEILNDRAASPAPLNLDGSANDFLRDITGSSVVAQVGEMTGFTRGDMNKIKQFITSTTDTMNYKFEGSIQQPRQWVMVMDGNKYEGIQRDDTGNRRFYPLFVGQIEGEGNEKAWKEDFIVDYSNFRAEFWQILAEAKESYEKLGEIGYNRLVGESIEMVKNFSAAERDSNSGTTRNTAIEVHLSSVLSKMLAAGKFWFKREGKKNPPGAAFLLPDFSQFFYNETRERVNFDHLKPALSALGATFAKNVGGNRPGYIFEEKSVEDVEKIFSNEFVEKEDNHGGF